MEILLEFPAQWTALQISHLSAPTIVMSQLLKIFLSFSLHVYTHTHTFPVVFVSLENAD